MTGLVHPLIAAFSGWLLLAPGSGGRARLSGMERIGFGILLGIGLTTLSLALIHLTSGVRLGLPLLVVVEALLVLTGLFLSRGRRWRADAMGGGAASGVDEGRRWTAAQWSLLAVILLLLGVAAWRADFYPVSAMDAHGYDGRARWIVAEGTLRLSVYDALDVGGRSNLTYPPLQPLASALVYWGSGPEGKVVDVVILAGLLLALCGFVARHAGRTAGLVAAFLVIGAPEVWRHASLGLTNLQAMAFVGAALLLLAENSAPLGPAAASTRPGERGGRGTLPFGFALRPAPADLLPALLLAVAAGIRPEVAVQAPLLALATRRPIVALPALVVVAGWQLVLSGWLDASNAEALRASWWPDAGRTLRVLELLLRHLAEPGLLGWTMPLLGLALAGGLAMSFARPGLRRRGSPGRPPTGPGGAGDDGLLARLLWLEAALALSLVALYQQIAPDFGGGGDSYLYNSLKRATFVLLPGAAAALVLSPAARRLLDPDRSTTPTPR